MNMNDDELTPEEQEFKDLQEAVAMMQAYLDETGGKNLVILEQLSVLKPLLDAGKSRLEEIADPVDITDWDELGFSRTVDEFGCVQFKPIYDAALELAESKDRVKEYMAHFMRRNWYLLPVPGREDEFLNNPEWADFWNLAYDANSVFVFGKGGYTNKDLFTEYKRGKYGAPESAGVIVPDHYVPWVGRNMEDYLDKLIKRFVVRWTTSGKGLFHAYNVARKKIHDMDDNRITKWSGYKTFAESNYNGPINPRTGRESSNQRDNPFGSIFDPNDPLD